MQMAQASKVVLNFKANDLPLLNGAEWAVGEKLLTRGDKSNRQYTLDYMKTIGAIDKIKEHLIFDPQTSGGLLISVPEKNASALLIDLKNSGDEISKIVGYVSSPDDENKAGTIIFDYTL
jgi:selenide,water dikinase